MAANADVSECDALANEKNEENEAMRHHDMASVAMLSYRVLSVARELLAGRAVATSMRQADSPLGGCK